MTKKVPVGGTISQAYGFAFGNIINNLGAIWVPIAIMYALTFIFRESYMNAIFGMNGGNPQAAMAGMRYLLIAGVVFGVLIAAQTAAITKEALALRTGSAWLQFPFGAAMWRLIGAYLLYLLVILVICIGILLASMLFAVLIAGAVRSGGGGKGAVAGIGIVSAVFGLFVSCALIYIATRLSFLLAPVVVAEHKISLIRAWELTKGNFWRIFVVLLAILLPLFILEGVFLWSIFGTNLIPPMHPGVTPEEIRAFSQHQQEVSRQYAETSQRWWFITYPLGLLVSLIFYGIFTGASAFAYRAVTASDSSAEMS